MKIALMTSEESFDNNYGAVLQGYALYKTIENMNHTCSIVRYWGNDPTKSTLLNSMYNRLNRLYHKFFRIPKQSKIYQKEIRQQKSLFKLFQKNNLHFWNSIRSEWLYLKKYYPKADAYVCGSDQIWNPNYKNGHNDPGYFLDFVPKGKKRIAYAPSFACDDIPITSQANLKEYIDKFDAVSVREKEGAEIIKKYTGRKVPVVADPTFLLENEEWDKIASIPIDTPKKYILCYRFMKNEEMTKCINYLSSTLSLPVITLPLSDLSMKDPYTKQFNAGPSDFIGMIKNATLVCTDSFHATAFSLIMNTPFYTFLDNDANKKGTNMNSRVKNVIGIAGLQERIIQNISEIDIEKILEIDFSNFNKNIREFREMSLQWLNNALDGRLDEQYL